MLTVTQKFSPRALHPGANPIVYALSNAFLYFAALIIIITIANVYWALSIFQVLL